MDPPSKGHCPTESSYETQYFHTEYWDPPLNFMTDSQVYLSKTGESQSVGASLDPFHLSACAHAENLQFFFFHIRYFKDL